MKVLMFHSIGNDRSSWHRAFLSVNLHQFETFCQYLQKHKYQTLFLDEWFYLQDNIHKITKKHIVLTFDDGYLDNWTFAYPLLKKYGLKGTIFINPEFVDPIEQKRKNLEDTNFNEGLLTEYDKLGFLSWCELKEMDQSGVMDIQSHSMSHNWFFKSNKIIDLYHGQKEYDWMAWIEKPERKPYHISENQETFVPQGYPIFENDRALSLRRYFPDKKLVEEGRKLYSQYVNKNQPSIEEESIIISTLNDLIKNKYPGRFESDEEVKNRYEYELIESKRILEDQLNKKIDFLCWPGGGYNDLAIEISKRAGYKASTLASKEKNHNFDNTQQYKRIPRFGMGSFVYKNDKIIPAKLKHHLVLSYFAKSNSFWAKAILKLQKIFS